MQTPKPSSYVGMFVIDLTDWTVLAGSDSKHPEDLKALGGMVRRDEETNRPLESLRHAVKREVSEEGQTDADGELIYVEPKVRWHTRYFFLANRVTTALAKGSIWEVEEKDETGKVVEKITTRWVPIHEFIRRLYSGQHLAFGAVLARLAEENPKLLRSEKYVMLMERFPAPSQLGTKDVDVDHC